MALNLVKGRLYEFNTVGLSPDHPFCIRNADGDTSPVAGAVGNDPVNGVTGVVIRYLVPYDAPETLVFQCAKRGEGEKHRSDGVCKINIFDIDPTYIINPVTGQPYTDDDGNPITNANNVPKDVVVTTCCDDDGGCGV